MKILGLGVPEMLIMLMLLVPVALVVALIVVLATEEEYALKKQECMRDL